MSSLPLPGIAQDVRFAFRMLRRVPAVSVPAILVLALGIGASTALYAVVYEMWLRPLPYPDPSRLVSVTVYFAGYKLDALASPDYGEWQGTRSLGPLGAYSGGTAALIAPDETVEVERGNVSGNLLQILQVPAALGRGIQPADDSATALRVVMLSDKVWRERFGGDAGAVGRPTRIDGDLYTIAGVLPRGFRMPDGRPIDVLTPLALSPGWLRHGSGGMKILRGVARLEPGVPLAQARAELATRLAASRAAEPQVYGNDVSLRVRPLHEYVVRDARAAAIVLSGAVLSILLIAGANVAGLLVARAAGRGREMAIRAALGASAMQIVRHLLIEGLTLGLAGVAAGLALARGLVALAPPGTEATINREVLAEAVGTSVLCALCFSLAPLLRMPRLRLRRALVAAELALSLVLVAGAALLTESFIKLQAVTPGFRTEQLVTASLSVRGTRFAQAPERLRRELSDQLQRVPGIVSAGFADSLPPDGFGRISAFSRSDRPLPRPWDRSDNVIVRGVDAGFFAAMGIALLEGRTFTPGDEGGLVAVVNRTLADRYFKGEGVVGKQVDGVGVPWKTVVGIVADTRNDGLQNPTRPEIDVLLSASGTGGGGITSPGFHLVIRTAGDPAAVVSTVRQQLRALDRALLARTRLMDEQWEALRAGPRSQAAIFAGFAALALLMAGTGIYGVLSHLVALRRREIGIRMALGARPGQMQALVVREALILAAAGVAAGLAMAVASSRLLAGLLYRSNPRDPVTLAATAAFLVMLAVGASIVPARRAAREDPAQTLRSE